MSPTDTSLLACARALSPIDRGTRGALSFGVPKSERTTSDWLARASAARWALAGLLAVLAIILVFTSISTWSTARGVRDTLIQGQAADLFHALRRDVPPPPHAGPTLAAFLEEHREVGLRFVAIVEDGQHVVAQAGQTIAPDTEHAPPPERVIMHGQIVRMSAPAGPHHPPPLGKRPPPHRPPGPLLVIEFEPAAGAELELQAQRSLAIGIAGAVGLLLVGGVFFSLSRRAAIVEAQLAGQRHLAALGEMSAVLAHELRNPLASLRGHAQLLEEQLPEGRAKTKAERVVAETSRLQQLIDGLLAFARSGAIDRAPVDPTAIVRAAIADLDPTRVDVDATNAPALWSVDGPRVQQVVANLVDNALLAAPPGTRVEVAIARRGDMLVITVRDHGDGVPAEVRTGLFEAFRTTRTRGVGLGLAVARRIALAHGGSIDFADAEPRGTIFRMELPQSGASGT
jgi:two-component system sensor histidine kinase HydH